MDGPTKSSRHQLEGQGGARESIHCKLLDSCGTLKMPAYAAWFVTDGTDLTAHILTQHSRMFLVELRMAKYHSS